MKQTPKRNEDPKVRLRSDLHERVKTIAESAARSAGISQSLIVDQAVEEWLDRQRATGRQPLVLSKQAPAPQNEEEEAFTAAAVLALRDKTTAGASARTVLQAVLDPWLKKVKALRSTRSA